MSKSETRVALSRKLAAVLGRSLGKRAAQMYQAGDVDRAARIADEKALQEARGRADQLARERVRAKTEEAEAALRSETAQSPELAQMLQRRTAYDEAVRNRGIPPFDRATYDQLNKNIAKLQTQQGRTYTAAAKAVAAKPAPSAAAPAEVPPATPPAPTTPAPEVPAPAANPSKLDSMPGKPLSSVPKPKPVIGAPKPVKFAALKRKLAAALAPRQARR